MRQPLQLQQQAATTTSTDQSHKKNNIIKERYDIKKEHHALG
jgi:hypothetical protein